MSVETMAFLVIIAMALVTLATRWGGVFIMSFIPISYRVKQFINGMSGSVLIAIFVPLAVEGDMGARLALLTSTLMMLLLKKPLPAIATGVFVAALCRQL